MSICSIVAEQFCGAGILPVVAVSSYSTARHRRFTVYNPVNFLCSCVAARHALNFVTTVASSCREESDFVFRAVTSAVSYLLVSRFVGDEHIDPVVTGKIALWTFSLSDIEGANG